MYVYKYIGKMWIAAGKYGMQWSKIRGNKNGEIVDLVVVVDTIELEAEAAHACMWLSAEKS